MFIQPGLHSPCRFSRKLKQYQSEKMKENKLEENNAMIGKVKKMMTGNCEGWIVLGVLCMVKEKSVWKYQFC